MPVNADPSATVPFHLITDGQIPEADRPTFWLRFLTQRERQKAASFILAASTKDNAEEAISALEEAIKVGLAGWKNMKFRGEAMEFGKHLLGEFLTLSEQWELAYGVINKPMITEDDKKKFLSQSATPPAASAKDADSKVAA